jgi:glutamate dehydrogenase (NAD(P)+)
VVEAVETLTGKELPAGIRADLFTETDELTLVRSGLDDTMRLAYQEISETFHEYPTVADYRTAAYVLALKKIATTYDYIGL